MASKFELSHKKNKKSIKLVQNLMLSGARKIEKTGSKNCKFYFLFQTGKNFCPKKKK